MCVCMYVCMYNVCMYLCMHVYVAIPGRIEHYSVVYFDHVTVFEVL